ncbi:Glycosyltransferase involved in cell wall bisynthesis [Clostridium amylolyticum]|uniref:Glycosyltransferase involved in cell wall bisynthesis n=1 Tax=Clostridium amylolyticum TaxID=1121298 RepID=A0A1M6B6K7_9CLOT|nr:glycosyltransferase family 1 protein [Clostridium amylolyticum]SHI44113.1 Glycosyltransferase involved in cell wall bisynthesis [Clostridium amylolyticum]
MKIGIDGRAAHWYRGTGIGTYTYQLINSLNTIDPINNYLILEPDNSDKIIPFKKNFSISNINANSNNSFWDKMNIPNIINNVDMDIYHVPQNGVGLPKDLICHKVITLHDIIPLKLPDTVGDRYLKIFNDEMEGIVNSCDGIITVSAYSQRDISKEFNYPMEKIYVTHLAAEDIYRPMDKKYCKKIIEEYYGVKEDFILYVGGFSPRKNIIGLIEAFSELINKKHDNLKLVITGKHGKSYDIYINRTIELGIESSVLFPGFIPLNHMPIMYNAALCLAYPSFYEGFGLPPLECMACGTPVISSNTTSLPEVLGDSALLINPQDIDELYQALVRLIEDSDLQRELINKGLERSFEFNWNKTALSTLSAYSSIIK